MQKKKEGKSWIYSAFRRRVRRDGQEGNKVPTGEGEMENRESEIEWENRCKLEESE